MYNKSVVKEWGSVCQCVCVRACVRACGVRACVRACVGYRRRACVHITVCELPGMTHSVGVTIVIYGMHVRARTHTHTHTR